MSKKLVIISLMAVIAVSASGTLAAPSKPDSLDQSKQIISNSVNDNIQLLNQTEGNLKGFCNVVNHATMSNIFTTSLTKKGYFYNTTSEEWTTVLKQKPIHLTGRTKGVCQSFNILILSSL